MLLEVIGFTLQQTFLKNKKTFISTTKKSKRLVLFLLKKEIAATLVLGANPKPTVKLVANDNAEMIVHAHSPLTFQPTV